MAGTGNAMPLDASHPNLQPESLTAEAGSDRRFQSSQPSSSPTPTPPETLLGVEMTRSLPQPSPQLTLRPTSPETVTEVKMTRSLSGSAIISNAQVPSPSTATTDALSEQSINIAQTPIPPTQIPRDPKPISPTPPNLPPQLNPLQSPPTPPSVPSESSPEAKPQPFDSIRVTNLKFKFNGFDVSTAFKPKEILESLRVDESQINIKEFQIYTPKEVEKLNQQCKIKGTKCPPFPSFSKITDSLQQTPYSFSLSQLLRIADAVVKLYTERGYSTSRAIVYIPKSTQIAGVGEVEIRVLEGELKRDKIHIHAKPVDPPKNQDSLRLNPGYVKSRLTQGLSLKPLNVNKLQENLRLLQLDPLIKTLQARISQEGDSGESRLDVWIEENPPFTAQVGLDNSRSPSIGSLQRRVALERANLLGGIGDRLEVGYGNTDGSNSWDASYTVPWNALNGTVKLTYSGARNRVVEFPFDDIDGDGDRSDIESNSSSYELTLRQPVIRHVITQKTPDGTSSISTFHEFALGLTASLRDSQTFLLDLPFPLSPGADDNGFTRTVALRFFQQYTRQKNSQEVLAFRSQFNLGLNALGSTINRPIPGTNEAVPDSRFFSWLGQAQWLRRILGNSLLVARANAQFADRPLLSGEQFAIGGVGSVRGYRQDTLQTDNGLFASMELRVPVRQFDRQEGVLQVVPFVDYGTGWNNGGRANPKPNSLLSVGLGVQLQIGRANSPWGQVNARLDWGIPLTAIESRGKTWQENGLTFSLQWQRQF